MPRAAGAVMETPLQGRPRGILAANGDNDGVDTSCYSVLNDSSATMSASVLEMDASNSSVLVTESTHTARKIRRRPADADAVGKLEPMKVFCRIRPGTASSDEACLEPVTDLRTQPTTAAVGGESGGERLPTVLRACAKTEAIEHS